MAADTSPTVLHTLCPECKGEGAFGIPRAALSIEGEQAHGFDYRPCPMCDGREWLAGLTPPT